MRSSHLACLLFGVFTLTCNAADPHLYEEARSSAGKCKESCENQFPKEKYPHPFSLQSCERGCRFFSMGKIVHARTGESVEENCNSACRKAYGPGNNRDPSELPACYQGCTIQKNNEGGSRISKIAMKEFGDIERSMMDRMRAMMSSLSLPIFRSFFSSSTNENEPVLTPIGGGEATGFRVVIIAHEDGQEEGGHHNKQEPTLPRDKNEDWLSLPLFQDPDDEGEVPPPEHQDPHSFHLWFDCRNGLPRWLLLLAIFSCTLIFVWLCFSVSSAGSGRNVDGDREAFLRVDAGAGLLTPLPLDKEAQITLWESGIKEGGLPALPLIHGQAIPGEKGGQEAPPPYSVV